MSASWNKILAMCVDLKPGSHILQGISLIPTSQPKQVRLRFT